MKPMLMSFPAKPIKMFSRLKRFNTNYKSFNLMFLDINSIFMLLVYFEVIIITVSPDIKLFGDQVTTSLLTTSVLFSISDFNNAVAWIFSILDRIIFFSEKTGRIPLIGTAVILILSVLFQLTCVVLVNNCYSVKWTKLDIEL